MCRGIAAYAAARHDRPAWKAILITHLADLAIVQPLFSCTWLRLKWLRAARGVARISHCALSAVDLHHSRRAARPTPSSGYARYGAVRCVGTMRTPGHFRPRRCHAEFTMMPTDLATNRVPCARIGRSGCIHWLSVVDPVGQAAGAPCPRGCTASGGSPSPTACSPPPTWPTGSAPRSTAPTTRTSSPRLPHRKATNPLQR